jgi:hypothetical protein
MISNMSPTMSMALLEEMKTIVEHIGRYKSAMNELETKLKSTSTDNIDLMQCIIERTISHKHKIHALEAKLDFIRKPSVSKHVPASKPIQQAPSQRIDSTTVSTGGIRVGACFQAVLPELNHDSRERGDVACSNREVETSLTKKRVRQCGTPGCTFVDNHNGPHSNDLLTGTRYSGSKTCCATKVSKARTTCGTPGCTLPDHHSGAHSVELVDGKRQRTSKKLLDDPDPAPEPEPEAPVNMEPKPARRYTTTEAVSNSGSNLFSGSAPILVPVDDRRRKIMCDLVIKNGRDFGGMKAGVLHCSDLFKYTLFEKGYSEGSVTECGKYRCDGNCYKYPRYIELFMKGGVFSTKKDFFQRDARDKAHTYAENAESLANGTKRYADATPQGKEKITRKVYTNLMVGFDTFVALCK